MKLLSILLTAILCATASAQTIKTLGYNSTNGQVVANTGTNVLTFTNTVRFADGEFGITHPAGELQYGGVTFFEPETKTWLSAFSFDNTTNAATTRANLGFSTNLTTLWTATNASSVRGALSAASAVNNEGVADKAQGLWDNPNAEYGLTISDSEVTISGNSLQSFRTALLPSYAGNSNKVLGLNSNATDLVWVVSSTNALAAPVAITNGGTGATNAATALTNLGLGPTNSVSFGQITLQAGLVTNPAIRLPVTQGTNILYNGFAWAGEHSGRLSYVHDGQTVAVIDNFDVRLYAPLKFEGANASANARTTARVIAGSTNTNEPYSGTVSLTNTNTLTFSNGVLLRIE